MAPRASDRLFRQLHRLFELGAVGMLTDAQLLDCFLRRRRVVPIHAAARYRLVPSATELGVRFSASRRATDR
jgi:hypothetical protein